MASTCQEADFGERINATQMRHRISTIYAGLDVPENERSAFYRHMGHSKEINESVYQCPLGIQEVAVVGGYLDILDFF